MKKTIFILTFSFFLITVFSQGRLNRIYDKHENNASFSQFEISGYLLKAFKMFAKEDGSLKQILSEVKKLKIVSCKNEDVTVYNAFTQAIDANFKRRRYKVVLQNKKKEAGTHFFVRANARKIKEFCWVSKNDKRMAVLSLTGRFDIDNLETLAKLAEAKWKENKSKLNE